MIDCKDIFIIIFLVTKYAQKQQKKTEILKVI